MGTKSGFIPFLATIAALLRDLIEKADGNLRSVSATKFYQGKENLGCFVKYYLRKRFNFT